MRRPLALLALAALLGVAVVSMVSAQSSPSAYPGSDLSCTNAVSGDGWNALAVKVGAPSGLALANQEGGTLSTNIRVGQRVCYAPTPTVPTTSTPTAPPPLPPPIVTTSTTLPPQTTSTTTSTTTAPTTTQAPTTTVASADGDFVETFTDNTGFERFDWGIFHRGDQGGLWEGVATEWPGDHDMACGDPTLTSRTIHRDTKAESFYLCRDHMMTSIGDTDGYSTGWFSPIPTFTDQTEVSWDVNVTDLGSRQWWEVMIVPDEFDSGVPTCPQCAAMDWIAPTANLPAYPASAIVVGNGPAGRDINIWTNGTQREPNGLPSCDGASCTSKAIRLPFSIIDNRNGTLTVNYGGFRTFTVPGAFPAGGFNVIFKDHNYTPLKDGPVAGFTWHWDSIVVR